MLGPLSVSCSAVTHVRDGSAASGVLLTAESGDVPVVVAGRMPEVHVLMACASGIARRLAGIPSVQDLTTIIPAVVILPVRGATHPEGTGGVFAWYAASRSQRGRNRRRYDRTLPPVDGRVLIY